jgi:hypothetical protein
MSRKRSDIDQNRDEQHAIHSLLEVKNPRRSFPHANRGNSTINNALTAMTRKHGYILLGVLGLGLGLVLVIQTFQAAMKQTAG